MTDIIVGCSHAQNTAPRLDLVLIKLAGDDVQGRLRKRTYPARTAAVRMVDGSEVVDLTAHGTGGMYQVS